MAGMTQKERLLFLVKYLISEDARYASFEIPDDENDLKYLFRGLVNIRPALDASQEFLKIQDEYLRVENASRGITDIAVLKPVRGDIYLWRGDITTLKVDAIVNAANSSLTGCWQPNHSCIDNCIHTFAGVQLRQVCDGIMRRQGHAEETGKAKITPAFNLPCRFVLHTVGPIVRGALTQKDRELLASCYTSCLDLAEENGLKSVAFCCISTGVFCFPPDEAAKIAVKTVEEWKESTKSDMKVIFNVFLQSDEEIYRKVLQN